MSELRIIGLEAEGDKLKVTHGQETKSILLNNQEARKYTNEVWAQGKDLKQVASVPFVVWALWEACGITKDPKELLKAIERNKEWKVVDKQLI